MEHVSSTNLVIVTLQNTHWSCNVEHDIDVVNKVLKNVGVYKMLSI